MKEAVTVLLTLKKKDKKYGKTTSLHCNYAGKV